MLQGMLGEAPGPLNFTMLLSLFGEKFTELDSASDIIRAFKVLDEKASGSIPVAQLKEYMMTMGSRFTEEEVRGP